MPERSKGRKLTKCKCPIWYDGYLNGKRVRESLNTKDWDRAAYRLTRKLSPDSPADPKRVKPPEEAISMYLGDRESLELEPSTLISYRNTFRAFVEHCDSIKCFDVGQISVETITAFVVRVKAKRRSST